MSVITSKYPGVCRVCANRIPAGMQVDYRAGMGITHVRCMSGEPRRADPGVRCPDRSQEFAPPDDDTEIDDDPFATALAMSRAVDADIAIDVPPGCVLKGYQRAGVAYLLSRDATILADEMGLGKTIQVIAYVNTERNITSLLVIAPKSLTINWQREWAKWSTTGQRAVRCGEPGWETASVLICSFEQAKKYRAVLDGRAWGLAVIDEAHRIKNQTKRLTPKQAEAELAKMRAAGSKRKTAPKRGKVQRTDAALAAIAHTRRRVFISGTPFENKPKEIFPLLAQCCPEVWNPGGAGFMPFARRYCAARRREIYLKGGKGQTKMVWDTNGASNMPELQERMRATCLIRRLKRDVLKELPPKIRQLLELDPDKRAQLQIDLERSLNASEVRIAERDNAVEAYLEKLGEMLRDADKVGFASMAHARSELATIKADAVADHVEGLLDGGATKVLIGCWHHGMMTALEQLLAKRGVVRITGKETVEERQANVDRFQADAGITVAIGQIDACGVGYTMTAASHVVLAELPWKPSQASQFEDRAHRIGQTRGLVVQHLCYRGSLDARMAKILIDKQAVMDAALD